MLWDPESPAVAEQSHIRACTIRRTARSCPTPTHPGHAPLTSTDSPIWQPAGSATIGNRATFSLPPAATLPIGTTHFAAVLLGTTELFTAVSDAIRLDLLP